MQEIAAGLGGGRTHGEPDGGDAGRPRPPDRAAILGSLSDPDGLYGIPAAQHGAAVTIGGPGAVAGRLAELAASGAGRVVVTITAGDWFRQAALLAEAAGLKG